MPQFQASFLHKPAGKRLGDVDMNATVELTMVLRPGEALDPLAHAGGPGLAREAYRARHATTAEVMRKASEFAAQFGLQVVSADAAAHMVKLRGTYRQAIAALQPTEIGIYELADGRHVVARMGHLALPEDLAGDVVAVLGLDQRPVARPHFRVLADAALSYTPLQVAEAYQFPSGLDGSGQTIGLIELGGGYDAAQMTAYFAGLGVSRTGTLTSVTVDGASNAGASDPNGADGEVQLDIEVAGAVAPGANIVVYFAPNQGNGFHDAISAAVNDSANSPSILSISWGGPESSYAQQDLDAMVQVLAQAATLGVTVCVASGDNGASDGVSGGGDTVDFPASCVSVLGCGGTSLPASGAEIAWNDGAQGGASGGGYSAQFAKPSWQAGVAGTKRGVPDVAGDADPQTGYKVSVDGQATVIGGTSAVAPLWAGLMARINQSLGRRAGFINPVLYASTAAFTDITSGGNNGYQAGPGWDPVTGLGSPVGSRLLAALQGTAVSS